MNKINKFLVLILVMTFVFTKNVISQTSSPYIGVTTSTLLTENFPFNGRFNYSWCEALYTASEMNTGGVPVLITKIAFDVVTNPISNTMNSQNIYIRVPPVGSTSFSSCLYPSPAPSANSNYTLAYSGSITYTGVGMKEIVFTNPILYDGTSPLIIFCENRDGTADVNYPIFRVTKQADLPGGNVLLNTIKRTFANSSSLETIPTSSCGAGSTKLNTQFFYTSPCPTLTISPTQSITCSNASAVLNSTTNATSPTYTWMPGGLTTASISVSPAVSTIYTLSVKGTGSCVTTSTVSVNVNTTAPGLTLSPTQSVTCASPSAN